MVDLIIAVLVMRGVVLLMGGYCIVVLTDCLANSLYKMYLKEFLFSRKSLKLRGL